MPKNPTYERSFERPWVSRKPKTQGLKQQVLKKLPGLEMRTLPLSLPSLSIVLSSNGVPQIR